MLRNFIILGFLVFLTQCGRQAPEVEGIDFPPNLKHSFGNSGPVKAGLAVSPQNTKPTLVNGVTILNAPLVILREETVQYQTEMTAEPGS